MDVQIEDKGKCRKALTIKVPAADVDTEIKKVVTYFQKNASLPGFRKGKAPELRVRSHFSKDILKEVREVLIAKSYRAALEQEKLKVEQLLDMKEGDVVDGEAFELNLEMDTRPDITLPKYMGIELKREPMEVTDAQMEEASLAYRQQFARFEDLAEARPLALGDLAQINYTATIDGKPLKDVSAASESLSERKKFWVRMDENVFLPEFREGLEGVDVGGSTAITVTFPETFTDEALRGLTAEYAVDVIAIRERKVPEMNDAFVEQVGEGSVEALQAKLREDLDRQVKHAQDTKLRNEVVEYMLAHAEFDLPESVLSLETQQGIQRIVRQTSMSGEAKEAIEEHKEEIFKNAEAEATKTLKLRYMLLAVSDAEQVEVSDKEVEAEVERMSQMYGMPVDQLKKILEQNQSLGDVRRDLVCRKTVELLFDKADIKD
ncbi:MAG: trigger factor [Kiritimatiellia bacterium]|jgi:trigger factor